MTSAGIILFTVLPIPEMKEVHKAYMLAQGLLLAPGSLLTAKIQVPEG